jgi:hypothetical protein
VTPRLPRGGIVPLALALAPAAGAFTVEVGEIVTLLDVEVMATALDRSAIVRVINRAGVPASCTLILDTGPEEYERRVDVPPGDDRVFTRAIRPETQKVRIRGTCR